MDERRHQCWLCVPARQPPKAMADAGELFSHLLQLRWGLGHPAVSVAGTGIILFSQVRETHLLPSVSLETRWACNLQAAQLVALKHKLSKRCQHCRLLHVLGQCAPEAQLCTMALHTPLHSTTVLKTAMAPAGSELRQQQTCRKVLPVN